MVSLHLVGAETSTTCSLGPGLNCAIYFRFFFVVIRALRGMPNARRIYCSFCVMCLLSLPRAARVKRGAESAFESFEELQKELKKSLFDGSAQFSLVV